MTYLITYFGHGKDRGCVEKKTRAGLLCWLAKHADKCRVVHIQVLED